MKLPSFLDLLLKKLTKKDWRFDILRDHERDVIKILPRGNQLCIKSHLIPCRLLKHSSTQRAKI